MGTRGAAPKNLIERFIVTCRGAAPLSPSLSLCVFVVTGRVECVVELFAENGVS